ncbi:MAG TPA: glycosyltransferase [Pseudonocardiaceae bacterium]|nr:glycosyltransferase [Pseudonocardiaceae bacterium]
MAEPGPPVAGTVVPSDRMPAARVLAASYLTHHPGHRFVVVVLDGEPEPVPGCVVVGAEWLDVDRTEFLRMATSYTGPELAAAVKPLLLRRLLTEATVALYLSPDVRVYAPFAGDVAPLAAAHDIVLTPRFLEPLPLDDREPDDAAVLAGGMFDLGFLAVSQRAKGFLDFFAERLRQHAIVAPQRWADQIPALFRHFVLRDPGFAAAHWNLHERTPVETPGGYTIGGEPLRFFHFAGYRPDQPWLLSADAGRPRTTLSTAPVLRRLCESYRDELLAAGHDDSPRYGFDALPDGTPLTVPMRRAYRHAWLEAERPDKEQLHFRRAVAEVPPHPFAEDAGAAFRAWLSAPSSPPELAAGLNRMTMLVWASRPDLRRAYPWPCGADAAGFREWCHAFGAAEDVLPAWAMPVPSVPVAEPVPEFGVNVAGYLTAELGLGEMGRIALRAVQHAGVPVVSVVEEHSLSCRTSLGAPDSVGRPRFPVSLLGVNADQTELLLASCPEIGHHRYRIGLWAWELEDVPPWQRDGLAHVDEIWTVSEFCRAAFARHAAVPVKVFPVPVFDPGTPAQPDRRPGPVRFLFCFDYNSTGQRKNPWGVVSAFQRAFPGRDDVRLVLKSTNAQLHVPAAERLRSQVAGDARIEVLERYLTVAELADLYAGSDCYVSLHRSEGFGLTVAEAMVHGLPVIATDYSGTTEFFDARVGWPVPYRMVRVGPGWYPYQQDALWAEPDLDVAAAAMRQVADDPAEAARRGAAAREHVLRTRSTDAAAAWVRTELGSAYRTWADRARPTPLDGLGRARQALHWRADAGTAHRNPLAPVLRRAVLRAIDHYDVHQRHLLAEVVEGTAEVTGRLGAELADLNRRLLALEQDRGAR